MTIFLTEKSIDDMIDTKRNGIKKYKEEEYGLQKKEKFDMEGRILSFFVVLLVFGAIFAAIHTGG